LRESVFMVYLEWFGGVILASKVNGWFMFCQLVSF
jgi:hypothetical protein